MRFTIVLCSSPQLRYSHFLFDNAHYLMHALESMGHSVHLSGTQVEPGRINILLNSHIMTDPSVVRDLKTRRIRYVVFQTEVLNSQAINGFGDGKHYDEVYLPLMRQADGVWEWTEDNAARLRAIGIQAHNLRLGYHPRMEEIHHKTEKDIDLLWYGSVTAHRRDLLQAIIRRGLRPMVVFDPVAFYRNDLIARARICLSLQQTPTSELPTGRVCYLVNNACVVAGEAPPSGHWLDPFWEKTTAERVPDQLADLLARPDLDDLGRAHQDAFRSISMVDELAPHVDRLAR